MRASVLLAVALLAVTSHAVSAQRKFSDDESGEWTTALGSIVEGTVDAANCGGIDQLCCTGMRCNDKGVVCTTLGPGGQAQLPKCKKCGGGNEPACAGLMCNNGVKADDILGICPIVHTPNPVPVITAQANRVTRVRQRRSSRTAVAGAAVSAASAAMAISDDIAAGVAASKPDVLTAGAAAEAPTVEETITEVVTASAAEVLAMVDMSAGALYRPCRTQELWPGMVACDGTATCQFAGNGSPGICL